MTNHKQEDSIASQEARPDDHPDKELGKQMKYLGKNGEFLSRNVCLENGVTLMLLFCMINHEKTLKLDEQLPNEPSTSKKPMEQQRSTEKSMGTVHLLYRT